jgi:plastocyanin
MSGHNGRARRPVVLAFAALLGASAVVLPAVASSEASPTIQAYDKPGVYEEHRWKPPEVSVASGGVVTISNPSTETNHGVEWVSVPATPSCSPGVPVGKGVGASGKSWTGTCTFSQAGTYVFYCTVHGPEMTGTIKVTSSGTTTTSTTPTTTGSTTPAGGPTGGGGAPSSAAEGGAPSPLAGSATSALKLPASQHGGSVRGSVAISQAGAGGRLEVDVLAKSASLATSGHANLVRVGKLVLSHLRAGKNTFSVPLNGRARRALRRRGRLALSARIAVSASGASGQTLTRSVVVRA